MLRRFVPITAVAALLLAACGSDGSPTSERESCPSNKALDAVKITEKKGAEPKLTFDKPLTVKVTSCRVIEEGDGDVLKDGSTAIFNFVFLNGRDGKSISSSYEQEPAEVPLNDELMAGVKAGLEGLTAGTRVLIAITPEDGFGAEGDPQAGLEGDDVLLLFVDLIEVRTPLKEAKGTAVKPVEGLPVVTISEEGAPEIDVPEGDPPTELVAQLVIKGQGAEVTEGQTLTVHYTGVLWTTGDVFDSSWDTGQPASFPIGTGGVIPGWDKGLVGQKVGSRVLLVIPPADGYGETGSGETIPPNATLVFVVDILDAHGG